METGQEDKRVQIRASRLSPQQRHLWRVQQASPGTAYRAQCAIRIQGQLDVQRLRAALEQVVARHEVLRTRFERLPGVAIPVQAVAEGGAVVIAEHDLRGLAAAEQAGRLEALYEEALEQGFDLEQGPVVHLRLAALAGDEHELVVSVAALCADGASLGNLMRELGRSYAACVRGEALADEPLQYADIAEGLNEILEAEDADGEAGRGYWARQELGGLGALKLPFEREAQGGGGFRPAVVSITIASDVVAQLEAVAERYAVSAGAVLAACWQVLLWRLTGQSEPVMGLTVDGRLDAELEGSIGLFAKHVPLGGKLQPKIAFGELLEKVQRAASEAEEGQE